VINPSEMMHYVMCELAKCVIVLVHCRTLIQTAIIGRRSVPFVFNN